MMDRRKGRLVTSRYGPGLDDSETVSGRLESAHPEEILRWAWDSFGPEVAVSSSFQTQSVPLLHMVGRVAPDMRVLFLDTGFHFQETLAFRDRLVARFGLNLEILTARGGAEGFRARHGPLYRTDPDLCCYLNKIEPLRYAQEDLVAWIAGIRRDQTPYRRHIEIVSRSRGGLYKICPLANWTSVDVESYLRDHDLPEHPLTSAGYRSIGCAPCTQPVAPGEEDRSGRWRGEAKTECGLHLEPEEEG